MSEFITQTGEIYEWPYPVNYGKESELIFQ